MGKIKEAKEIFLKLIKLNPNNVKAYYRLFRINNNNFNKNYLNTLKSLEKNKNLSLSDKSLINFIFSKAENTKNVGKESLYTGSTVNLLTLADLLIIRNWLNYAKLLGDKSFEKIFTNNIRVNYLENVLKNQLDFRINEL